ncbi:MAG: FliH/SctL family protein [Planctomycetota bacterium]
MLLERTFPLVAGSRARVTTRAGVTSVRASARSLDEIADALAELDLKRASEAIRREAFMEATETAAKALASAAERIELAIDRAEESLSCDAVELGVEIARQILKLEVQAGNYDLERIVRATLGASDVKRGRCVVYVHPDDAAMLEDTVFREETEVRPDASVPRGGVHVETPRGLLVRDASAALEEIREQLLEDLV